MNDRDIDEIFERAANYEVAPALLGRVSSSLNASLRPIRPMAPASTLVSGLLSIAALVAIVFACLIGLDGIRRLSAVETGIIFPVLAILAWLAAMLSVGEMTPGSARRMNPTALLLIALMGWLAVDALLFHDYQMGRFVKQGIPCLRAGLMVAIPTGAASWLLLRRGFAVNPAGAGLAAGTLAGLAGLAMLELHCPNLHAMHIMVWHTAVVPISGLVGALLSRIAAYR